jgi:hypothetical protein
MAGLVAVSAQMADTAQEVLKELKETPRERKEERKDRTRERDKFLSALRDASWRRGRSPARSRGRPPSRLHTPPKQPRSSAPDKDKKPQRQQKKKKETRADQAAKRTREPAPRTSREPAFYPGAAASGAVDDRAAKRRHCDSSSPEYNYEVDWEVYSRTMLRAKSASPERHFPRDAKVEMPIEHNLLSKLLKPKILWSMALRMSWTSARKRTW